jgi:YegS/Rv2252/BmrU family lipid kinase
MPVPYPRIHVVVNPAAGKNEPILNTLNDVFHPQGVEWDVSVTLKYGDARRFARQAVERGVDLVAGYGGDGTQHEVANGLLGSGIPMAVLPGGTGNGFCREMGVPLTLREAAQLIVTSRHVRRVDAARLAGGESFVQRLYTGVDPERQTSRELKDRFGVLAYPLSLRSVLGSMQRAKYRLTIDGQVVEQAGVRCYVINSAMTGKGLMIDRAIDPSDGWLDVLLLDANVETIQAMEKLMLDIPAHQAGFHYWRGREIALETDPPQPIWTDGEHTGQTPISLSLIPGALPVVVP